MPGGGGGVAGQAACFTSFCVMQAANMVVVNMQDCLRRCYVYAKTALGEVDVGAIRGKSEKLLLL